MATLLPLFIACPCQHEGQISQNCSTPTYWYHSNDSCPYSSASNIERKTLINNKLELQCSKCQKLSHIKFNQFHCDTTHSYRNTTAALFSNVIRALGQMIGDADDEDDLDFLITLKQRLKIEKW